MKRQHINIIRRGKREEWEEMRMKRQHNNTRRRGKRGVGRYENEETAYEHKEDR